MSQNTGLFSVRRPRETLGSLQNYSSIPQPASAMKAPNTAQHARSQSNFTGMRPPQPNFKRSSSGGNLADMGMSTVRRSASTNAFASVRQSLAPNQLFGSQTPASANAQRRSSIYSRPSNHGPVSHQSFFLQSAPMATNPKDQRPLRDPSYRARIAQELMDYLTQNNFEMDMKCALRQDSLKSPSQKEFINIFQWLYRRVDPGYRFQKGIDVEVPPILKQLRYPYAWQITKSQLGAVGSQTSWPVFLGLLHWLMQLAQMLENFTRGAYDDACAQAGVDVAGDRIVFRFLFGAYQDWLSVGNDEDEDNADAALQPHIEAMAEEFERINSRYVEDLKMYEAENQALKEQVEEMEKTTPDLAKLDNVFKILEDDTRKFEEYNTNVAAKIEKYESRIKILEKEIQNTTAELTAAEDERQTLQQQVDDQGLSMQDIDRMNTERERLTKSHDDAVNTLDEVSKKVLAKEIDTAQRLEDLENTIKRYNSLGYQLSLIPSTAANARGHNYELELHLPATGTTFSTSQSSRTTRKASPTAEPDRLLASTHPTTTGHSPAHLLNLDLRGSVRSAFVSLRKEINERRKAAADADLNARDMLENVVDALAEKNNEIDNLNYRIREASSNYSSLKETGTTAHTQQTSAIERLEAELARMREGLSRGAVEMEQRELEATLAWEQMQDEAGQIRAGLHADVEKMLEEVVSFKVHVQRGLEEFETTVGVEVEEELMEGDIDMAEGAGEGDVFA
jgi:kinetochore protein NDC80